MKIETERLLLRELTLDDHDALYEILSDPETMQHYPNPFDEERTRVGYNGIFGTTKNMDLVYGLLF